MMKTRDLLDAAKAARGLPSNYRLARELDVPEKTVQRWSTGRNFPDDVHAARLAELAGFDPGLVVAWINAERSTEGEARALWVSVAERLERAAVAACVTLSLLGFSGGPDGGALARTAGNGAQSASGGLYIMSTRLRRWLRSKWPLFGPQFIGSPA